MPRTKVKVYVFARPESYIIAYLRDGELAHFSDEPLTRKSAERQAAEYNALLEGTELSAEVVRV